MESATLQQIETFGAGIVALGLVFGVVILFAMKIVPALKQFGTTLSEALSVLGGIINELGKTMQQMQEANKVSMAELKLQMVTFETKLDYHVAAAARIETKQDTSIIVLNEVKERTRNCTGMRTSTTRSRREDLL